MQLFVFKNVRHSTDTHDAIVVATNLAHARAQLMLHPLIRKKTEFQAEVATQEPSFVFDLPVAIMITRQEF